MAQQTCEFPALPLDAFTEEVIEEIVDQSINEDKEWHEFCADNKTHVLFVFHIPEETNSYQLLELFLPFGAQKAIVMTHEKTGRSRGFGFVHFATRYQGQVAINYMDGFVIGHKRLRVAFKKQTSSDNHKENEAPLSTSSVGEYSQSSKSSKTS